MALVIASCQFTNTNEHMYLYEIHHMAIQKGV